MEFNIKKASQALVFFAIREGGQANKMKALKLVWLADRLHLRRYGRPILNDFYCAMKNGPVASGTRDLLENNLVSAEKRKIANEAIQQTGKYSYEHKIDFNHKVFSKSDLNVLEEIYQEFGIIGKFQLSDISHNYPEWKKFENQFSYLSKSFTIDYFDFFKNGLNDSPIFNQDPDLLKLNEQIFEEEQQIRKALNL